MLKRFLSQYLKALYLYYNMAQENNQEIPGMEIEKKYSSKSIVPPSKTEVEAQMEKTKKKLEKLSNLIIKKYPYVQAISVLPVQSVKMFIEDELGENIPKEEFEKLMKKIHLHIIIPEEKLKSLGKLKEEIIKEAEKLNQDVWIYVKTPVDIWETCLDSKFEIVSAIGASFPLHDKGILQALRVAEIHKSLILQRFEKYIVSYVIAGSIVRGEAIKTSDLDVFVIINDTDVKKMPRLELKERLRKIISQHISEASALAKVKNNMLNVQTYLLTDFWESVKDAHPVIFTFIRDGVPLYDRGTFLPWKALLKDGKLKPSPESINMFMSMGDKTVKRAKATLMDILVHDIYWGVITPSQALLMLYGSPPPTPKQTIKEMKNIFVEKEKMLETKYIDILERIVSLYKDFEHEKLKEIKGEKIDKLLKDTEEYLKRLKDLREQIEKDTQGKIIEQIHKDLFSLLETILGKKNSATLVADFNKKLVKTGKLTEQHMRILKEVISAKGKSKKSETDLHKTDKLRRDSTTLINDLIEYSQRKDLITLEKGRMLLIYDKDKKAELLTADNKTFLLKENTIKKITNEIKDSNNQELSEAVESQKVKEEVQINPKVFELVKKELGEFEIVL